MGIGMGMLDRPSSGRARIAFLDEVRGLAVLGVLAFHTVAATNTAHRLPFFLWPLAGGKLGVDAFFVLSGFVITKSWAKIGAEPGAAVAFLSKRVKRLFPAYWAS